MSADSKKKGFTSTTPPASLTKLLLRSLSRLKARTPSNTTPVSSLSLKSVWLYDWWLVTAEGKGLAVSGFTFREFVSVSNWDFLILGKNLPPNCVMKSVLTEVVLRENWGLMSSKLSSGITAKAASVSFDDLPVTRIRDILMHPVGDSKDCVLAYMLEQSCSNDVKLSPISTNTDTKNPVTVANTVPDETIRTCKRKAGQKYKDGGKIPRTVDTVMGECITPSRGIVTRSMSRLRNLTEIREETPLSNHTASCKEFRNDPDKVLLCSSIKSKDNNFLSTSDATKNQSRVMRGMSAGIDRCSTSSRLMDVRKMKEENLSSNSTVTCKAFRNFPEKVLLNSSIKSKDDAFLSTSEAIKNRSRGMISTRGRKGSWATTSSEKVMEAPVVPLVRRSSRRCNIRKDYRVK